jgi:hypothetical protein
LKPTIVCFFLFSCLQSSCQPATDCQEIEKKAEEVQFARIQQERFKHNKGLQAPSAEFTPLSFIEAVKKHDGHDSSLNFFMIRDTFPTNWVKREHLDTLMALVHSTERCNCYVNPLSSYFPLDNYAEIGGFAQLFIQSFIDNKPLILGRYLCPKVDESINEKLSKWWHNEK